MNADDHKVTVVAGSAELLIGALPVEPGRVSSRHILKAPGVRMVRIALDAGQTLAEHTAAVPVLVQVLAGRAVVEADGESTELPVGGIIYLAAGLPHSVEALEPVQLTLTLLDGYDAVRLSHVRKREHESRPSPAGARQTPAPSADVRAPIANHVVLSSSGADADAVDAVTRRHAELSGTLAALSSHLLEAAASGDPAAFQDARGRLTDWCHRVLIPQFTVEAGVLYPAADAADGTRGAALVEELRDELERIGAALDGVSGDHDPADVAASAVSLRVAVARHLRAETERLLPLLAASPSHSLATLWEDLWAELGRIQPAAPGDDEVTGTERGAHQHGADQHGAHQHGSDQHGAAAACECGVIDEPAFPELDVRTVPHAIRHATVFGALDAIAPGGALVLVAPHDPLPLLAQIEQRAPGRFGVSYLQRGPDDWRLQLTNTGSGATV
jgi:uncharacterized protein (DUF2249 family)/quercetin dioxygenase-like cupin family protein